MTYSRTFRRGFLQHWVAAETLLFQQAHLSETKHSNIDDTNAVGHADFAVSAQCDKR